MAGHDHYYTNCTINISTTAVGRGWLVCLVALAVALGASAASTTEGTQLGCAGGKCYVHHTEMVTWEQARAVCAEDGRGRLAVLHDRATQSSVSNVIQYSRIYISIWIGARNTGSTWTWADGRPFYGDEVDYYDDPSARCGYLYTGFRARIAAATCNTDKKYLCATIEGNVPSRGARAKTWYEANHDCAARQKVLPMLNQEEMQKLSDRLVPDYGHDEYWVGLCRQGWVWEDLGQDVTFTNFNAQTPYCTENKCMSVNYRGQWFNEDCFSRRGFLCEIPDSGVPPVITPKPTPAPPTYVPPTYVPPTYVPPTLPPVRPVTPVPTPYVPAPVVTPHSMDDKTTSTTLEPHPAHGKDEKDDAHSHSVLIGVIVGLGVVITALIVLLVLLILRKRRGKQAEDQDNMDNIYAEIREPPSSLPQPPNPAMANLYLDNPSPHPSPKGSPVPKPRSKPMPLPKPDNLKSGCEMSTFKNHNPKRLSMAPPSGPPPDQPPPDQPRYNGSTSSDPTIGPYAVSYIACTPKLQDKSCTLDSLAALPIAPKPPTVPNGKLSSPESEEERSRYVLPKDDTSHRPLLRDTAAHGHKGKGRKGKGRESASLMLEENDLYDDVNCN